ncbi:MAG: TonB family protein [bacterium]|nr:TonB family protein [bacterium]
MDEKKHIIEKRFCVFRSLPKHPKVDKRRNNSFYIEMSLIITLSLVLFLALFFGQISREKIPYVPLDFVLNVYDIPETTQAQKKMPPRPKLPAVPIPSDIEELLDEMEYEVETLDFVDLPEMPVFDMAGTSVAMGPKPYHFKLPDIPDSEKKKKKNGEIVVRMKVSEKGDVIDHEVVKNTTGSTVLEEVAVKAALHTRFTPAKNRKNQPITVWTQTTYYFGDKIGIK